MTTFAVQYLGSRPKDATPKAVRDRLREACLRLPISMVLLDWNLPPSIEEAVADEAEIQQASLYRWQTWLTGDPKTELPPEWAMIGLDGNPIPGHGGDPDFTFICPNRSGVEEFLAERLEAIAASGLFQGIFLDRIRFPSPAANPAKHLGCFCKHCASLAADAGLDLEAARRYIQSLLKGADGPPRLAASLLGNPATSASPLEDFLNFREKSITRSARSAKRLANSLGLAVGLDCFSPALTRMIGQDLNALNDTCDWIKIMTYPRVFGPAGISFELLGLVVWLMQSGLNESEALNYVKTASGLPIPQTKTELGKNGLVSESIALEIRRGRAEGITNLLAGIALVEAKSIHASTPAQIQTDLLASRAADGLVLSWDLWQIPLKHLDSIRHIWEAQ